MTSEGGINPAREEALTAEVVRAFASADPRLKEILSSLVTHLHAFIREVRLTPEEWRAGIDLLAEAGRITDDRRQEFILLSDVLGASMQTVNVNAPSDPATTESTVLGPFFAEGSPLADNGEDIARGAPGSPCWVEVEVRSESGEPIPGARVEVWGAGDDGLYDVQRSGEEMANRAHFFTSSQGGVRFWGILPSAYPIPVDGPVGKLLTAAGRSEMRPAHLHFLITAEGHSPLVTHIFVSGDRYLATDAVFGVRASLVAEFEEHGADEDGPDGRTIAEPWYSMQHVFVLAKNPEPKPARSAGADANLGDC